MDRTDNTNHGLHLNNKEKVKFCILINKSIDVFLSKQQNLTKELQINIANFQAFK